MSEFSVNLRKVEITSKLLDRYHVLHGIMKKDNVYIMV